MDDLEKSDIYAYTFREDYLINIHEFRKKPALYLFNVGLTFTFKKVEILLKIIYWILFISVC